MTEWEYAKEFLKSAAMLVFVLLPTIAAMLAVLAGVVFLSFKAISSFM